jgi:hypothetical protein
MHEHCRDCQDDTSNSCYWCEAKGKCLQHGEAAPAACIDMDKMPPTPCPACDTIADCQSCSQAEGCGWCGASCKPISTCKAQNNPPLENCDVVCATRTGCEACTLTRGCSWCTNRGTCEGADIVTIGPPCTPAALGTCPRTDTFDAGSFVGGMFLVIGLSAIGLGAFFLVRFYRRRVSYTAV